MQEKEYNLVYDFGTSRSFQSLQEVIRMLGFIAMFILDERRKNKDLELTHEYI